MPAIQNIETLATATEEEEETDTRESEDTEKMAGVEGDEEGAEVEDTEGHQGGRQGASIGEVEGAAEGADMRTGGEDTAKKINNNVVQSTDTDRLNITYKIHTNLEYFHILNLTYFFCVYQYNIMKNIKMYEEAIKSCDFPQHPRELEINSVRN